MTTVFDPWSEIKPVSVRSADGRTINPYATYGPGNMPGVSWHEYFVKMRADDAKARQDDDDEDYEIVITKPAEEFDDPCSPLAAVVKLAHKHGWLIHTMAHAFSFQKGKVFKGGAHAGEKRPDSNIELQWAFLEKGDSNRIVVSYTIINDKVSGIHTYRSHNGRRPLSDAELKEGIRTA